MYRRADRVTKVVCLVKFQHHWHFPQVISICQETVNCLAIFFHSSKTLEKMSVSDMILDKTNLCVPLSFHDMSTLYNPVSK